MEHQKKIYAPQEMYEATYSTLYSGRMHSSICNGLVLDPNPNSTECHEGIKECLCPPE